MRQDLPVLDAVVEPRRREIMRLLSSVELPAGAIAAHFPDVSRPAVSQHLRLLKEAGLVRDRREGTRHYYSVDSDALAELREYFESFWEDALAAFKEAAEKGESDDAGDE